MEQFHLRIPWSFASARVALSWPAILFGMNNALVPTGFPYDAAMALLEDTNSDALLSLAFAARDAPVRHLVEALAAQSAPATASPDEAWLYLALAWTYAHRDRLSDPLALVETVCVKFGYPESVAHLMRSAPWERPNPNKTANEARIVEDWVRFLEGGARRLGPERV